MKFLCGRPGCGKESTATLQIDAVASTVSLVDPRVSRDGVPLCPRHADSTTPPLGWSMNDLRTTAKALGVDSRLDESPIAATPPRVRPERDEDGNLDSVRRIDSASGSRSSNGKRMSHRQSIAERARREAVAATDDQVAADSQNDEVEVTEAEIQARADKRSKSRSKKSKKRGRSNKAEAEDGTQEAPDTRPARRRETEEEVPEEEDRFPWHFQFDDDEPAELKASTPLLSRAFRASTG